MTSILRIALGAVAMAALAACVEMPLHTAGYKVVRSDGPTSYLLNTSTGECIAKTKNNGSISYKKLPTEDC